MTEPGTGWVRDPYRTSTHSGWRFLYGINPLARLAAPILPILLLFFVRDIATPAACIALVIALLLVGVRMSARLALLLCAIPLAVAVLAISLALWTDPATLAVPGAPVLSLGSWSLTWGALLAGLASSLRVIAMMSLALVAGVGVAGPDLVRAAVQHLHLPYRIGYTALAAYRFIPRFRHELGIIKAAHRVRGHHAGRGPLAAVGRWWGYLLPLMAGAIRHAERVALAMDARAFGAHPTRTERHLVPWRARDWVFLLGFLLVCAAIFAAGFPWTVPALR